MKMSASNRYIDSIEVSLYRSLGQNAQGKICRCWTAFTEDVKHTEVFLDRGCMPLDKFKEKLQNEHSHSELTFVFRNRGD